MILFCRRSFSLLASVIYLISQFAPTKQQKTNNIYNIYVEAKRQPTAATVLVENEEVAEGRRNVVIKILMIFIIYLLLNVQCHKITKIKTIKKNDKKNV